MIVRARPNFASLITANMSVEMYVVPTMKDHVSQHLKLSSSDCCSYHLPEKLSKSTNEFPVESNLFNVLLGGKKSSTLFCNEKNAIRSNKVLAKMKNTASFL